MNKPLLKALYIFIFSGLSWGTYAQQSLPPKIKRNSLYAGIDVGSKGVKLSIISMGKNAASTGQFTAVKDSSVNTDFISFTPASFHETLGALTGLYNAALTGYDIPAGRIFTVVSSGVKGQAEKENKSDWIIKLSDSFRLAVNEPGRVVDVIDVTEEARLSHLGIVPEVRRYNTFLIDIGSGNTKGGYFKDGNTSNMKLFNLSWGTKTITNATNKRIDGNESIGNYEKQLARVLAGDPETEIIYAVNESGAYNMNDNFAFSGGISWSVATLLYPEMADNAVVPFTYKELEDFNERLTNLYNLMSPSILTRDIKDEELKQEAMTEISRVQKVFDQKALMAGTGLLLKIVRQFEGTLDKKKFFLVKNGQVGWISAYVNQTLRK
ncbi:MAG: hypothetical protein ABIT96_05425 [Ferruginibacter sp.]